MIDNQPMSDDTTSEIETEFAELEAQLAECGPGVIDIMRLYGEAENNIQSASNYFSIMNPSPVLSTSNTSG